jgi:hypothetical protein
MRVNGRLFLLGRMTPKAQALYWTDCTRSRGSRSDA